MQAVIGENITFSYDYDDPRPALDAVSFDIGKGEFVAILGANGCGKSSLVKHLNAIVPLQEGKLCVLGRDLADESAHWQLRRDCAMVFQNPDNQFVSSVVEEDVAFGLRNYDTPEQELGEKVAEALGKVGMSGFERRSTHALSGGQKQRIALAGVLALEPELIIFDEATSMLDPDGRQEVLQAMHELHQRGKTVIMITHYVAEAVEAERIILMREGKIAAVGTPREILADRQLLQSCSLLPPLPVQIYLQLRESGIELRRCPLTDDELLEEICLLK